MNRTLFKRLLSTTALVAAALVGAPAQAGPFSNLFVFGDSLSDNGNNFLAGLYDPTQVVSGNSYVPSYTYASHVYSNGPVWATYFAAMLGLPLAGGGDYAFGGATTGTPGPGPNAFPYSLREQVDTNLAGAPGHAAQADGLYVIAGGGNNARAALGLLADPIANPGGANSAAIIGAAALGFANDVGVMVDELQLAGAQHILVWNTPNLGLAPAVVASGGAATGSFLATVMNNALGARLAGEAGVTTFDLFGFGGMLASNPAAFGFTNVTDACGAVANANCSQYAYWDGIHPTTAAHRALANAVALAVPEPETYALLALGLVVVALQARRRMAAVAA